MTRGQPWPGVIAAYRDYLPVGVATPVVTLLEGGTPLVDAPRLSEQTGARVLLKLEGLNPTGSFKDRGMTLAMSKAVEDGAKAVICASTGNTSASAAAYAVRAGLMCAVVIPEGHVATGKLAQALIHGARVVPVRGNFDAALGVVRELALLVADYPGDAPVYLALETSLGERTLALGPDYRVKPEADFFAEARALLGEACIS